jgi:hypothetical protein
LKEIKDFFQEQSKTIYSQSFQQVLKRLETSFQNFFRRCKNKDKKAGFPRFRSKDMFKSIVFPQSDLHGFGVKLLPNNKVNIFGVGEVKVEWHRPFQGRCKQVILKREHNKFYIILSCDEVPNNILPKNWKHDSNRSWSKLFHYYGYWNTIQISKNHTRLQKKNLLTNLKSSLQSSKALIIERKPIQHLNKCYEKDIKSKKRLSSQNYSQISKRKRCNHY